MMGHFGNSRDIDKDSDWAEFFASESNQENQNFFDIPSSSTSKGKNVIESSDSMMPEFTQSWNHTGWHGESSRAHGSSSRDFESMPYNPPYNSFVENPISQSLPIMPNSFEDQNAGISFDQNVDSNLVNSIYYWSLPVENELEKIISAGPTQTSMANPLNPNPTFYGNAPTTLANALEPNPSFYDNPPKTLANPLEPSPSYFGSAQTTLPNPLQQNPSFYDNAPKTLANPLEPSPSYFGNAQATLANPLEPNPSFFGNAQTTLANPFEPNRNFFGNAQTTLANPLEPNPSIYGNAQITLVNPLEPNPSFYANSRTTFANPLEPNPNFFGNAPTTLVNPLEPNTNLFDNAQTTLANPLEPNTSFFGSSPTAFANPLEPFFGNAPTTMAGPSNNNTMEQQPLLFNNQQPELNETRNDGRNYLQNQPCSNYFPSNLKNNNPTPMNPTNPNDTPGFFNQSPPANNHVVAPWNTQQVATPTSDLNPTGSQSPRPLLEGNPKPMTNELQKNNALNFQLGHRKMPLLESLQLQRQMNTGHSSTPNTFDYRGSLLDQGNKDTSLFHMTSLQTNPASTDIQSPSQLLMRKLLDPSFEAKNEQSVQQTSKLVDSLMLKGDSKHSMYDCARYIRKEPWRPLINQTFAPNYNTNTEPMQANRTEQVEVSDALDHIKFDPLQDTCLTANGDIYDPWLDQCYTQIQTIKKKCLSNLKMSLTMLDLRDNGSGLGRKEKLEAQALRKMINFLCMPIAEMKILTLRDFAHTKRQIMKAHNKIMVNVPQPMQQNSLLLSTPGRSPSDITRPPTPSVSSISIGRRVTPSWRESLGPKLPDPKKRTTGPVSDLRLSNKSSDKQQQASAGNDAQVGVQIPGPSNSLENHQVQSPLNLYREQETVQNQVGVQIPGTPNSLANHQVQNPHTLTREQETVQNQDLGQPSAQNQGPQLHTGPRLSLQKPPVPRLSLKAYLNRQNSQTPFLLGGSPLFRTQVLNKSPVPNNAAFSRPFINNSIRIQNAAQIAKEVGESEYCYAIGPKDDTVSENMPDLLSEELKNKMKRVVHNAATVRSTSAKKKNDLATKLLKEIQFINKNLADVKLEVDLSEDDDETYNVDGIVLVCRYKASSSTPQQRTRVPLPLQVFPVLKLRLIVPPTYPKVSPSFVEPPIDQPNLTSEMLIKKAYKLLNKCCRNHSKPMSLGAIATAWQACARAVSMKFGRILGKGTFEASDS